MRNTLTYPSFLLILALAVVCYAFGLDSRFAPKNGDEYVYMHIARMTADAGQWLPLQSEMEAMRNTKPPLVFWQGIASTDWASNWGLWQLRWPSLIYTGLTALLLGLAVGRYTGRIQTGLLAALIWLSFFATYRYGRPYLTDPPEVFFLSLPFFALLYWGRSAFDSKLLFPLLAAISIGLGLLYKSFAYVLPACFALALWYWCWRDWRFLKTLQHDAFKVFGVGVLALGIFALWFVVDPNPEAVWREFILGENAGKFGARSSNYFMDLIRGGDSIWMLLLSSIANAGLFTAVALSLFWQSWRERHVADMEERLLWLWILAFFIVFSLPSQRSGRYLLPIMPAIAALIAMHWQRLPIWGFRLALVLQGIVLLAMGWVSVRLHGGAWGVDVVWLYSIWHWLILATGLALVLAGLIKAKSSKLCALATCFLCYLALNTGLAPLEGAAGRYDAKAVADVQNALVAVPCDFRSKDEEYRLLLPGARLQGYPANEAANTAELAKRHTYFTTYVPQGESPLLCPDCRILGKRVEMRARHTNAEILKIIQGEMGQYLFVNEYLIYSPSAIAAPSPDACR
ncbi:MAG: phospholipid carrier-dependent glycosyltransferase [Polynucleobacter sp.]|nr:phospholipid carrier-dependent glycosyltransferase [Polynucleobacter sp.]MDZ4056852.1 phospholipid carrier-dependent glycosyltransferase [Polynucleobacter sp.]